MLLCKRITAEERTVGYRQMTITDLHDILRRWHGRHSISSIKEATARDRNTIRHYISLFENQGFYPGCELFDREELFRTLQTLLPLTTRKRGVRELLEKHKDEIIELINRDKETVKAKMDSSSWSELSGEQFFET